MATLIVEPENIRQKISLIQKTKDSLSEDIITPLQFGSKSSSKTSSSDSVISMETLNADLDAVAKKIAALSEATAAYLETTVQNFEEADRSLIG